MLYKLCIFNRQRFHELSVHMGGWLQRRQGAHLFANKTIASKYLPAGRTFLQMYIQLSDIYFTILQFPVCCKQYLCLDTIHASLSSSLLLKPSETAPPESERTPAPIPRSSLNNERGSQAIKRRRRNVSVVVFAAIR